MPFSFNLTENYGFLIKNSLFFLHVYYEITNFAVKFYKDNHQEEYTYVYLTYFSRNVPCDEVLQRTTHNKG